MSLYVLFQQRLLIERTRTDVTLELELIVHLQMLIEMRLLQELLVALRTLERKCQSMRLHVCVQLRLLLERLLRTPWTIVAGDASMCLQMLIERGDLSKFFGTLIAAVLLNFVVSLHVVVEVCDLLLNGIYVTIEIQFKEIHKNTNLRKRSATFGFNAYKGSFACMQSAMIVQVGNLQE